MFCLRFLCSLYFSPTFSLKHFYYDAVASFLVGLCFYFIHAYVYSSSWTFSLIILITFEIFSTFGLQSCFCSIQFPSIINYIYRNFPMCSYVFWYLLYFCASVFLVFLDIYPFVRCVNLLLNTAIAFLF